MSLKTLDCFVQYVLLGLFISGVAHAQPLTPDGGEFQVNTVTTDDQRRPAVAAGPDGAFVVAWTSYSSAGSDSDESSIQAQRYAADGTAVGEQFQVNTYTTSFQVSPAIAFGPGGDFVVVWVSPDGDGSGPLGFDLGIAGQRFDADGGFLGTEFQINSYTSEYQRRPMVATGPDGEFVVVWQSYGSSGTDASHYSIQGQSFDSAGARVGGEFQVNTYTTSTQDRPSVATAADSMFIVVWSSFGATADTSGWSIQGQMLAADGMPLGSQFQVNADTLGSQRPAKVAAATDGDFVVVWESTSSDGADRGIRGQRHTADGSALGDEFRVNAYTTGDQQEPQVAVGPDGSFVVVWQSYGSSGPDLSSMSVQGRSFRADGTPQGDDFQVNTYSTSVQMRPAVAAASLTVLTTWISDGSAGTDTDGLSVQGQKFLGPLIFADGFESGDTSAW